jgi:anti-anti-sigma factor
VEGLGASLHNWDQAWAFMSRQGWTGSNLAVGWHRCQQCPPGDPPAAPPLTPTPKARPVRWHAGVTNLDTGTLVRLRGELDLAVDAALRQLLDGLQGQYRNIILHLGDVPLVDSTVLGTLVHTHRSLLAGGGALCLVAPSPALSRLLRTLGLDRYLPTFGETDQARQWLSNGFGTCGHR